MKITVITATYNSAATVADTMRSVLAQTHPHVEHIIVDGCSTDTTLDVVETFRPRYQASGKSLRVISEPDHGIYDAMNKGIRLASGDVVGLLNSDDFYSAPDILTAVAEASERAEAVFGDLDFVDPRQADRVVRHWKGSPYTPGAFMRGWHPAHPTFYARRALFERLGAFDTSFAVSADFELMLRFIECGRCTTAYLPRVMVKMRIGGESTGSLSKIIQGNKGVLRAFRKNGLSTPRFYLIRRLWPKAIDMIRTKIQNILPPPL